MGELGVHSAFLECSLPCDVSLINRGRAISVTEVSGSVGLVDLGSGIDLDMVRLLVEEPEITELLMTK